MKIDFDNLELTDEQYLALVKLRGGCSCHISPPCNSCSDPVTRREAIDLGIMCPYCNSDNEYVKMVFFNMQCKECCDRM